MRRYDEREWITRVTIINNPRDTPTRFDPVRLLRTKLVSKFQITTETFFLKRTDSGTTHETIFVIVLLRFLENSCCAA